MSLLVKKNLSSFQFIFPSLLSHPLLLSVFILWILLMKIKTERKNFPTEEDWTPIPFLLATIPVYRQWDGSTTGMSRRWLVKKRTLEHGAQKTGLEMDVQAKESASDWGPWAPGVKGKKANKKWPPPLFKEKIWIMKTKQFFGKGGRNA